MQAYAIICSAYACSVSRHEHARGTLCVCARAFAHTHTHMQTHAHACIFMRTHAHAHARVCVRHACYHATDTDQYCQSCPVNTSSAAGSGSRLACVFNAGFSATLSHSADGPDSYLSISASSLQTSAAEPSGGAALGEKTTPRILTLQIALHVIRAASLAQLVVACPS